jgi:hypothetical protein
MNHRNPGIVALSLAVACSFAPWTAPAKTVRALSPSASNVADAIRSAKPGDTVSIPEGTAQWNQTITVDKPLTIRGAGVGNTIIINLQNGANVADGAALHLLTTSAGMIRVTGITFKGNRRAGAIYVRGDKWSSFRIDDCRFEETLGRAVAISSLLEGLIDNCVFVDCQKTVDVYGGPHANDSWNEPLTLGTTRAVVVEDCEFLYRKWYPSDTAATSSRGLGARSVIRYCTWRNSYPAGFYPIIDVHGNQLPVKDNVGNHRGSRQFEMYENTFITDTFVGKNHRLTDIRGGTCLIFNNKFIGVGFRTSFRMREEDGPSGYNYRSEYPGHDPHMLHIWDNYVNGRLVRDADFLYPTDPIFIVENRNLFWKAAPNYKPLAYPHPFRSESVEPPSKPTGLTITTASAQ